MSRQRDSIEKAALEAGLKIRTLEWEPIGICLEMQGPCGGWFVETVNKDPDGYDPEFVAYNATDICQMIRNWKKHGMELNDRDTRETLRIVKAIKAKRAEANER